MNLSFDISTSSIGIAFGMNKIEYKQFNTKSIKDKYKNKEISDFNLYVEIAKEVLNLIDFNPDNIIIEEPIFNSVNRKTVNKLITINTIISTMLSTKYNKPIIHQNVNKVRSWMIKQGDSDNKDVKAKTIEILNSKYKFNLNYKLNDAADAIMHLLYFNTNNNESTVQTEQINQSVRKTRRIKQ